MTVYVSRARRHLLRQEPPCPHRTMGRATITGIEAARAVSLAGGRDGAWRAERCEPCDGWHMLRRGRRVETHVKGWRVVHGVSIVAGVLLVVVLAFSVLR